jgi:hypothetical protein
MSADGPENSGDRAARTRRCYKVDSTLGKQMFAAMLSIRSRFAVGSKRAGATGGAAQSETNVGDSTDVELHHTDASPEHRRSPIERAVLVPVGAALLAVEELIGVATALTDAEKAGRELLHFEERGVRARAHVEGVLHHHRGRLADQLELQIEQTRNKVNGLASKGSGIASKIRPQMPKHS